MLNGFKNCLRELPVDDFHNSQKVIADVAAEIFHAGRDVASSTA
jgi:hypothetical protein